MDPQALRQFEEEGWVLLPGLLDGARCDALTAALAGEETGRRRGGRRDAFRIGGVAELAGDARVRTAIAVLLRAPVASVFAVRALVFDKTARANWQVPWHRDAQVAVRHRHDASGFTAWTLKDGVHHVGAPGTVMAGMVAARFHLDPVGADDGPVSLVAGSHRLPGSAAADPAFVRTILAERGSMLLMRPLLVHASKPARSPRHRRVLQVEYAHQDLPAGLAWRWRIGSPGCACGAGADAG